MIAAWDSYMEVQPPSAIGITLVEAFARFMHDRWGFERYELYEIFVSDDTDSDENRFARGAVTSCAAIVLAAFIDGSIATFARPLPAGSAIKLTPSVWEIDDPLPRFATGCFNLEHWFDHTAPLTHRIFVDEKGLKAYLESMMSEEELWEALTSDAKKSNEVAAILPAPVLVQRSESELRR